MSKKAIVYKSKFEEDLESIAKLAETPNFIRETAINAIGNVLVEEIPPFIKAKLENVKKMLENIEKGSIKEDYGIIYSQMCVLAVSCLEALLKMCFIDLIQNKDRLNLNYSKLKQLKITALDIIKADFDYRDQFAEFLLKEETGSFQSLRRIMEMFENYFSINLTLDEDLKRRLIFYLELRHLLVHKSGIVDQRYIKSTDQFDANLKNYDLGDKVELNEDDWEKMRQSFIEFVELLDKEIN